VIKVQKILDSLAEGCISLLKGVKKTCKSVHNLYNFNDVNFESYITNDILM